MNINGMDSSIRVLMQLGPLRVVVIKLHGDVKMKQTDIHGRPTPTERTVN